MAEAKAVQSQIVVMVVIGALSGFLLLAQTVAALAEPVGSDPDNPAIKRSAFAVPLCWLACGPLLFARPANRSGRGGRLAIRLAWVAGCALLLLHIAVAFHLGHGWSHQHAWDRTKQISGYGDGIFVSYAFALVWLLDAVWLCVAFDSYFARPRWLHWAIHGFLAFVVVNAAVVYADWGSRGRFIGCALLATWMAWAYHTHKRREIRNDAR